MTAAILNWHAFWITLSYGGAFIGGGFFSLAAVSFFARRKLRVMMRSLQLPRT